MSQLTALTDTVLAMGDDAAEQARGLGELARRMQSASQLAASLSRSAPADQGPALNQAATLLSSAARQCNKSAQALAAAQRTARTYAWSLVGGAPSTAVGLSLARAAVDGAPQSSHAAVQLASWARTGVRAASTAYWGISLLGALSGGPAVSAAAGQWAVDQGFSNPVVVSVVDQLRDEATNSSERLQEQWKDSEEARMEDEARSRPLPPRRPPARGRWPGAP